MTDKIAEFIDFKSSNELSKMSEEEIKEKVWNALRQMADDEASRKALIETLYQCIAENPDERVADSLADRVVQSSAKTISEQTTKKILEQRRWLGRLLLRAPKKDESREQQKASTDPSNGSGERDGQDLVSDEGSDK